MGGQLEMAGPSMFKKCHTIQGGIIKGRIWAAIFCNDFSDVHRILWFQESKIQVLNMKIDKKKKKILERKPWNFHEIQKISHKINKAGQMKKLHRPYFFCLNGNAFCLCQKGKVKYMRENWLKYFCV